ncbi:MAG: hypothetical protein ACN4GF_02225 [Lentimonas sp.]
MKINTYFLRRAVCFSIPAFLCLSLFAKEKTYNVDSLALDGGADGKGGRIVISATLGDPVDTAAEQKLIYAVDTQSTVKVAGDSMQQVTKLNVTLRNGKLEVIELNFQGDLEMNSVVGADVASWSVRNLSQPEKAKAANLQRQLLITLKKPIESGSVQCVIKSGAKLEVLPAERLPLLFSTVQAGFLSGDMKIFEVGDARVDALDPKGLALIHTDSEKQLHYRIAGEAPSLRLELSHLRQPALTFNDYDLQGVYGDGGFSFVLTGTIEAFYDREYSVDLLSGDAALTKAPEISEGRVVLEDGAYRLKLKKSGSYPVRLEFDARVHTKDGRSSLSFDTIDAALQRVQFSGLPVATDRVRLNNAPLEEIADRHVGSLAGAGVLKMQWTDPSWKSPQAVNATLIYAAENLVQVAVGNGLIRQSHAIDVRIMQGSMKTLSFDLKGQGEITRVEGDSILNWRLQEGVLQLDLNKAYTSDFSIQVHSQYAMDAFPAVAEPLRIVPQDAIRYSGFTRIVNQGAISIDVPESTGLAQISPEYFPAIESPVQGSGQVLAYRFSDTKYSYTVRAENILPEVAVTQILQYHIGQEDQSLTAEMELTVREAPLRDFFIRIPEGFALANLQVQSLADYFITEDSIEGRVLRLVFTQPLSGRVLIKAEFENNRSLNGDAWVLPPFAAMDVKSVRGHVGVSSDPGLRVSVSSIDGLSEQAANFFPKKVKQLQLALRMREVDWKAELTVEELPQSIQADALHLYSVAEGWIYGSSVINYLIAGAPVSSYQIQVPEGIQNLDFAGRDVRGWSDLGDGLYEVQLHSPASGAYTLLATYEAQFASQEATIDFSGVAPLWVDSEQGYVVVVSNFPFALGEVLASVGVLRLEPGEIPAEFRLLYDAQELAAFQYSARPMEVALELGSLAQAQGADQVIDFVDLKSHISRDGEILTAVDLMLKSKGQTHFRMQLPAEHRIWSARVAGEKVSPIAAADGILLPLPSGHDPNNAVRIQLELASQTKDASRPVVTAPALFAPSLLVNWELTSDPGYGLRYYGGDISSSQMSRPISGFGWFQALLNGELGRQRLVFFAMVFFGLLAVVLAGVFAKKLGDFSLVARLLCIMALFGSIVFVAICGLSIGGHSAQSQNLQDVLTLRTPIELSTQPLQLVVENRDYTHVKHSLGSLWPFIIGIGLWVAALMREDKRELFWIGGWVVNFLAALHYAASGVLFIVLIMLFFFVMMLRPFRARYLQSVGAHALCVFMLMAVGGLFSGQSLEAAESVAGEALTQAVLVEKGYALVDAELVWLAEADTQLTMLSAPATLLSTSALPAELRLLQTKVGKRLEYRLEATVAGEYRIQFRYRVKVGLQEQARSLVVLPVGPVLSSRASIEIVDTNIELESPTAVSLRDLGTDDSDRSVYDLVFNPNAEVSFSWMPKQRDSSEETAVYHVESSDVFTPLSGLVSGYHQHKVRLSQGQVDRLQLDVPAGMTITSVGGKGLASWQFDPGTQQLICFYQPVQTGVFVLNIFSQYSAGTLPYTLPIESLRVVGAASQLSLVAFATNNEVQIGKVESGSATTINLEDFPTANVAQLKHLGRVPVLRRAYRWGALGGAITVEALPVQPDLRVTTQETVSLGEDRIVLKADIVAVVNRAGLFKLSMPIPADYDVESVSGSHLSHWNELVADDGARSLQLHMKGKTMGETKLNVSLSGPGLGAQTRYVPPILKLDGTDRQNGTLAVVPELGYRLNPVERQAALQLDPAEAGMSRQKLLLFRILNSQAALTFSVERVEPWIEVEKLQRVAVRSGLVEVKVRYNFNVENAGIRTQRFQVPSDAIGVQFTGEGMVDAQVGEDGTWTVKLNRKMVGAFNIDLSFQVPLANQPTSIQVHESLALDVDQQSGFLALVPHGRIQLQPVAEGDAFQNTEVPMVGMKLRGDLRIETASHLYRLIQQGQSLEVGIKRHAIAELVPAQVRDVQLASVISGQGAMLTKVTLSLDPGDKRMLRITLPEDSQFWFGFVNQQSVWPWREGEDLLLQLEAGSIAEANCTVEFFYATTSVTDSKGPVRASLRGPRLDLPLENIKWSINYPETWDIKKWDGNLTQERVPVTRVSFSDLSSYMEFEKSNKMKQKVVAENFLIDANVLLSQGKQQEARQAFNSAYNLSQFDAALNEDARVQLKNVREDQALVALANRRNSFVNDNNINTLIDLQQAAVIDQGGLLNYTAQAKKEVLRGNSAEENDTLRLLAARLIDQQQAVPGNPQAIQTIVPQQGQVVSFTRSLQINDQADLIIEFKGKRSRPNGQVGFGFGMFLLLFALVGGVSYVSRK